MKRREEALEAQLVHMHDSSAASPVDAKSLTCDLSGRMRYIRILSECVLNMPR